MPADNRGNEATFGRIEETRGRKNDVKSARVRPIDRDAAERGRSETERGRLHERASEHAHDSDDGAEVAREIRAT